MAPYAPAVCRIGPSVSFQSALACLSIARGFRLTRFRSPIYSPGSGRDPAGLAEPVQADRLWTLQDRKAAIFLPVWLGGTARRPRAVRCPSAGISVLLL